MIGVRIPDAKVDDYDSYNGDAIIYGDHGELILVDRIPAAGDLPAVSRVMAVFAPGHWVSAKQLA